MSTVNETTSSAIQQYLSFSLGEETFATSVSTVREIMDFRPLTKVPQTPDYMLGVINLRGSAVPVVDLHRILGLPAAKTQKERCIIILEIICNGQTTVLGAVADGVSEVFDLAADQIEPPPRLGTRLRTDFIRGLAQLKEQMVICLDIERIIIGDRLDQVQADAV